MVDHTLCTIISIIAAALLNYGQRSDSLAEPGTAGMILEAYKNRFKSLSLKKFTLNNDISDYTSRFASGLEINNAKTIDPLAVLLLIIMSQQLIAAADSKHDLAVLYSIMNLLTLMIIEIIIEQILLIILSAAHEDDIIFASIVALPDRNRLDLAFNTTPDAAALQRYKIAPISIEIKQIRIEMTYSKLHLFLLIR